MDPLLRARTAPAAVSGHEPGFDASFLFQSLVRHAPIGIAFVDRALRFRHVNEPMAAINGRPSSEHIGRTVAEVVPDLWPALRPTLERVLARGEAVIGETLRGRVPSQPDEEREWRIDYYPLRAADGGVIGVGALASDFTERIRAERKAERLVAHHRAMLAAMPDFIFELSRDGTHLDFHAPRREGLYLEPEQFIGRRIGEVMPPTVAALYDAAIGGALGSEEMQSFEYTLDYGASDRRIFEARMVRSGEDRVLAIVRDVTGQRALEERLLQSQRMEALGQLAGGVAHDFNNLLTIINACSALALDEPEGADIRELLREIGAAGARATTLTRQLLVFSRQQVTEPSLVELSEIVAGTETMLRRLIGQHVRLVTDLAPDLPAVRVDVGQVEQALVNLIVNARDAMGPDGGTLRLATDVVEVTAPVEPAEDAPPSGRWVTMRVEDDGSGMTDAVRRRIFEPFFSTKPPGRGTGLGLAVVFGIVKRAEGYIDVRTSPGRGTAFTLYFPAVANDADAAASGASTAAPRGGGESILVVEDEPSVRSLAVRILIGAGYRVRAAAGGREAIAMLTEDAEPVDLLLTDVMMPSMNGRELAERLRTRAPTLPVLFMSGYTDDDELRQGVAVPGSEFLQKPFTAPMLAARVRDVLDRARRASDDHHQG